MKVQGRTRSESTVKWINVLCVSTGLVVGIVMVTPFLTGEETAQPSPKEAVRFSLGDDNADGTVTTRKRAPIVHRNVDRLRENGLRYQQPETGLRDESTTTATPQALDPSKDPVISTIPKAPIISSSEALALKKQREAEKAAAQASKEVEQKAEAVAESEAQEATDPATSEAKSEELVATQDADPATPKQSDFALPELDLPAIELPALELPQIELPDLAKVFEFGSDEVAMPKESTEPKIDADAIVRQHLQKQDAEANGPLQPDMNLIAEGNLPAIDYPNQQLPGLSKNMALVPRLNPNAAAPQPAADQVAGQLAGQLTRDIDMGSSFVPTPMRVKPESQQSEPEIVEQEQIAAVQKSPMNNAAASIAPPATDETPQQAEEKPQTKQPQDEQLASNSKPSAGFSFPEIDFPTIELPEMSLPEFEFPSFELPQISLPQIGSSPVQQASSEDAPKPAAPAVAVEQKPAPIVNKAEQAVEVQLPPMPEVKTPMDAVAETLTPGTPPNRLRKQPAFVRPFANVDKPAVANTAAPPSKPVADVSKSASSIETVVDGWESAVKQVSGVWQLGGLAGRLKSTNAAGISGTYEAVWMRRNAKKSPSLSQDLSLDGFDYESSNRLTVGHYDNDVTGVELVYMGELGWTSAGSLIAASNQFSDSFFMDGDITETDLNTFGLAQEHHQRYDVSMHSVELMKVWRAWDVMKTSVGVRYVNVNENFLFRSVTDNGTGLFTSDLDNHIAGLQFGMEFRHTRGPRLSFGLKGKAGIYGNFNDSITRLTNGGVLMLDNDDKELQVSFVGELGLDARYRINDRMTLRAGYELLFVTGVATVGGQPHLQLNSMTGSVLNDDTDILVHGGSVGLEFTW